METIKIFVLLVIGFVLLIKGADLFVDGSSSVAKLLKVPSVIIGLTIVSLGTSAPEAAVSVSAGIAGSNQIAVSNIVGSNFFNLMVVAGVCAIIKPFIVDKVLVKRDFPICIGLTALLIIVMIDGKIALYEGIIFLLLMVAYIALLIYFAMKNKVESDEEIKAMSPLKSIVFIVIGAVAIMFGGDFVVDNACEIARMFGMSETLIGLTIIAFGTSLPELVTSIVAAKKGESGLALGNVIGSNIFNIIFILGLSSSLNAIGVDTQNIIDTALLFGVTVVFYIFCRTDDKVKRWEGVASVIGYACYTAYIIMR